MHISLLPVCLFVEALHLSSYALSCGAGEQVSRHVTKYCASGHFHYANMVRPHIEVLGPEILTDMRQHLSMSDT